MPRKDYIGIKVDPELKSILKDIAGVLNIPLSELIRRAVMLYLLNDVLPSLPPEKRFKIARIISGI